MSEPTSQLPEQFPLTFEEFESWLMQCPDALTFQRSSIRSCPVAVALADKFGSGYEFQVGTTLARVYTPFYYPGDDAKMNWQLPEEFRWFVSFFDRSGSILGMMDKRRSKLDTLNVLKQTKAFVASANVWLADGWKV